MTKVTINNIGGIYTTYNYIMENSFKEWKELWKFGDSFPEDYQKRDYVLLSEAQHDYYKDKTIALIQDIKTKQVYIIGKKDIDINKLNLPKRYIINKNATILFWTNEDKTIVKLSKNDKYDKRLGFLTAYFQKMSGMSKNKANKYLDELIEEGTNKNE